MPRASALAPLLIALTLAGCSGSVRPTLYPNARYQAAGAEAADSAVAACMALARGGGSTGRGVTRSTGRAAAVGGASGAAWGSFSGNAGRGLVAGAAVGAVAGLVGAALAPSAPSASDQAIVQRCLRDQGYEVIGWR